MSDREKVEAYCKAHPGQFFTAEDLARHAKVDFMNVRQRIREISKKPGYKTKRAKVKNDTLSKPGFTYYKKQTSIAWIGE